MKTNVILIKRYLANRHPEIQLEEDVIRLTNQVCFIANAMLEGFRETSNTFDMM